MCIRDSLKMPHYIMICDVAVAASAAMEEIQYSGQDFIQTLRRDKEDDPITVELVNSHIDEFFDGFSETEGKYQMKPWLRKQYPRDA